MFDQNALVTVWSAPNYCYRCGNSASIMQVDGEGKVAFKVYEAADENLRDVKNPAMRRAVSLFYMPWIEGCETDWKYRRRLHISFSHLHIVV